VSQPGRRGGYQWGTILAAAVLLIAGFAGYLHFAGQRPSTKSDAEVKKEIVQTQTAKSGSRALIDAEELEPGVDGGSTSAGLPYFYRRQLVYYRSVYTPGMIVVDRSQRFLYLVEPQTRAIRYGIGIGGECSVGAGLRRINRVVEWPEWRPSPSLLKRKSYPKQVAGGPGNPLGARAVYFEDNEIGIHGTNAPKSIGQALTLGCFRMVNDDIADLVKRTAPGAGVVVMN
jgi:lipoprotein-anchoring transpeptidase ErfK/SrfK